MIAGPFVGTIACGAISQAGSAGAGGEVFRRRLLQCIAPALRTRQVQRAVVPQFDFFRRVIAFPKNPSGSSTHPRTALTRSR